MSVEGIIQPRASLSEITPSPVFERSLVASFTLPPVFTEAFKNEPDYNATRYKKRSDYKLDPTLEPPNSNPDANFALPVILTTAKLVPEIGSRRLVVKLAERLVPQEIRYLRKGGRGRGPCGACDGGREAGHHGGSRCRRRGMPRFNLKSQQTPVYNPKLN